MCNTGDARWLSPTYKNNKNKMLEIISGSNWKPEIILQNLLQNNDVNVHTGQDLNM